MNVLKMTDGHSSGGPNIGCPNAGRHKAGDVGVHNAACHLFRLFLRQLMELLVQFLDLFLEGAKFFLHFHGRTS